MRELIAKFLEDYEEEFEDTVEIRVGRISAGLLAELDQNRKEHEAAHDAIKAKIDAYIEEVTKEHSCQKFRKEKSEIWEKIYDELNLNQEERGLEYTIERSSCVVSRVSQKEETKKAALN